jgi:hypothetical protein
LQQFHFSLEFFKRFTISFSRKLSVAAWALFTANMVA